MPTYFFVTINYAVNMILNAIDIMKGFEIFIIKNMNSIKIYDLALALKKHYNFSKKISINGEREGEKLYEELATSDEKENLTTNKNFIILKKKKLKKSLNKNIQLNSNNAKKLNKEQIISFLKKNHFLN